MWKLLLFLGYKVQHALVTEHLHEKKSTHFLLNHSFNNLTNYSPISLELKDLILFLRRID